VTERVAAGVDVGGTKLLAVAVAADGEVLDELKVATPASADGVVEAIADIAESWGDHLPVGLGIAGLVDREGVLRVSPNLPGIASYPFGARLTERLGAAVIVDNDATLATWGELKAGAARGATDAVFVGLGTGIGGGVVSGGVLQRGANGFGGEAGHMIVDPHGPLCPCGRRGCWERFASGTGLGRLARDAAQAGQAPRLVELAGGDAELVRGEHVAVAAAAGDTTALDVVWEFAWWVAVGIANLVNVLDPEVVVIGGGLAEMGEVLLDPVRSRYRELVLAPEHRPEVPIVAAQLGERAGAIGAALVAAELT
jgi:glucokinase